jgi:hypothetical protein
LVIFSLVGDVGAAIFPTAALLLLLFFLLDFQGMMGLLATAKLCTYDTLGAKRVVQTKRHPVARKGGPIKPSQRKAQEADCFEYSTKIE